MAVIARSGQRAGAVVVRAFPWRFLVVPLAMSALALGSAAAAELAYSSRALPGLTVAGVAVGSLEAPALRERLESEIAAPWAAAGVTLRDGDREWTTTNGALGIVPDVDAAVAAALAYGKGGSALDRPGAWTDALSGARLDSWVSALGAVLDHPAKNAKFRVREGDVLAVVPSESGVRVDQTKLRALLGVELLRPAGGATREVAAPAGVDAPALTTEKALALVPQLSRTSTSTPQYPPSDVRHANISTRSSQFDGVVIMPGETFSFWDLLGPVTPDRGYRYAGAIINGRSDENVIGGGLCQVSTPIFNAISRH